MTQVRVAWCTISMNFWDTTIAMDASMAGRHRGKNVIAKIDYSQRVLSLTQLVDLSVSACWKAGSFT